MSFSQAISTCFGKYATFAGRAPRSEYWNFFLFLILGSILASVGDLILLGTGGSNLGPLSWIFFLGTLLPYISVAVRRLHDVNRSGFWLLVSFLLPIGVVLLLPTPFLAFVAAIATIIIIIAVFIFSLRAGTAGSNFYGPDPLAPWEEGEGREWGQEGQQGGQQGDLGGQSEEADEALRQYQEDEDYPRQ